MLEINTLLFLNNLLSIPAGGINIERSDVAYLKGKLLKHKILSFDNGKELLEFLKSREFVEHVKGKEVLGVAIRQQEWRNDRVFGSVDGWYELRDAFIKSGGKVFGLYGRTAYEGTIFEISNKNKCYLHLIWV